MKILFIGGNGNISWHCSNLALQVGHEVYLLNRGETLATRRDIPPGINRLTADIRNPSAVKAALGKMSFDVVCDFICYNQIHAQTAVALFSERVKQYIFISSAAIYARNTKDLPFQETSPRYQPDRCCEYIQGKLTAEEQFMDAYDNAQFPVTIVRPAYTYDTILPFSIGGNCFTAAQRYLDGKPALVVGDGNNLWAFTHSLDFAQAFMCLLGNSSAVGEDYHIASERWYTWNDATELLLQALRAPNPQILHVPFEYALTTPLAAQREIFYEKIRHNTYDITKIKKITGGWQAKISLDEGLCSTVAWLNECDVRRRLLPQLDGQLNEITEHVQGKGR